MKKLVILLLAAALLQCINKKEEAPIDTLEGKILALVVLDTRYASCPGNTFTQNSLTDAAGDPKYDTLIAKPTSFSYDDIISARVTQDTTNSKMFVDITLASLPSTIRYNKSELSGQVGEMEYQWSVFFEKGNTKSTLYWAHRVKSIETTSSFSTFLSTTGIGFDVNGTIFSCLTLPTVSGNTITLSCPYAANGNIASIDSTWTMSYYVVSRTSSGLLKDCL